MKNLPVNCQYSIALVARHGITALGQASESFRCLPTRQHHARARVCTSRTTLRRYDATTPQRCCALATAAVPRCSHAISTSHRRLGGWPNILYSQPVHGAAGELVHPGPVPDTVNLTFAVHLIQSTIWKQKVLPCDNGLEHSNQICLRLPLCL